MTHDVAVLGATGAVGQRFVQLIDAHDEFAVAALTASGDSAGRPYREAAKWRLDAPIPDSTAGLTVRETRPDAVPDDVDLVFSALPSAVGERVEPAFCEAGHVVSSNASNDRLAADVPLTIPEVNPDHLDLIEVQRDERGWDGALVKNPNCSTITLVPTLAALDEFGVERVDVATLQAVSGAGYSGVTSMEIIDNAIPHIDGEAEKMETETRKLLGAFDGATVEWHDADVSASCNRIPTLDGHLENAFVDLRAAPSTDEVGRAFREFPGVDLPSAPDPPIRVFDEPDRPQPRLDRNLAGGMAVAVGGVTATTEGVRYNCLAHNTLRGAAGASLLNGELLVERGWI